ncbi:MAG: MBL fold metallo-hydrolase [Polaromonas sp.]|uniref:MBL fold metallo-hydrolase n=1 Tax=Polaromonas sp. TaxID=1869339 RepID=UPI0025FDF7B7|nr:MBL fold metallo-hydrolase [Polaromonas sp.]MBI2728550.1 MBL fold metallo-hydrolase [Polaromonas sp.]
MLRFKSLGSGSSGNATVIESGGLTPLRLLVDCGLGIRQLQYRLAEAGLQAEDIHAVFITHEHGDHIGCARALSLRYRLPVWMSRGTHAAIGSPDFEGRLHFARDGGRIDLGGMEVTPFAVPHDAREPLQITCTDGSAKLAVVTDLGHATPHVLHHLSACDALVLECNHDSDMLARSAYPYFLKRRVGGDLGHLSNEAAAVIAAAVCHPKLKHLVAAHLSKQNNLPALARTSMATALGCAEREIVIADAGGGTPWLHA